MLLLLLDEETTTEEPPQGSSTGGWRTLQWRRPDQTNLELDDEETLILLLA